MSININVPDQDDLKPRITVLGVGGAGGNAVNNMIKANLEGVDFWVANTDAQALENSLTNNRIRLGLEATRGLGAGSHPEVGQAAAEESYSELQSALEGSNMLFITAGMGGGTGTGAGPVIAQMAKEMGLLTVGVVTKPFQFEGARRMRTAEEGLARMQENVDTLIVIPNQNLFRLANEKTTFADAFIMADDVLQRGVRGITDLITMPGLINLDFADIRTVMREMGKAMMGTGEAEGENRAIAAAEAAISNPLLDISSMQGARGVLINITGGMDMTLYELDEAANRIREEVDSDANIIVGSAFNESLQGKIRVSVVATGIDQKVPSAFDNARMQANAALNADTSKASNIIRDTKAEQNPQSPLGQNNAAEAQPEHAQKINNVISKYNLSFSEQQNDEFANEDEDIDLIDDYENEDFAAEEAEEESHQGKSPQEFKLTADENPHARGSNSINIKPDYQKAASENHSSTSEPAAPTKKKADIFDIPAFLRRKK